MLRSTTLGKPSSQSGQRQTTAIDVETSHQSCNSRRILYQTSQSSGLFLMINGRYPQVEEEGASISCERVDIFLSNIFLSDLYAFALDDYYA